MDRELGNNEQNGTQHHCLRGNDDGDNDIFDFQMFVELYDTTHRRARTCHLATCHDGGGCCIPIPVLLSV
ncbi:hypothetical protein [Aeoliella sp.]|uniref:hypothetical protein n=1 Tax=Aeoliella sp. TaxID=2795800 RepID=UPI003CCC332C